MPRAAKSLPPSSRHHEVSTELVKLLEDKFSTHEARSNAQIKDLKSEMVTLVHQQDQKAEQRHKETFSMLSEHSAKLDVHNVQIKRIEEATKELHEDRKASHAEWKRWSLGILAMFIATAVTALLQVLKGGK